jgi:hypothetical protein
MARRGKKRDRVVYSGFFAVEAFFHRVDQRLAQAAVARERMARAELTDSHMDKFRKNWVHDGVSRSVADKLASSTLLAAAAHRLFNSRAQANLTCRSQGNMNTKAVWNRNSFLPGQSQIGQMATAPVVVRAENIALLTLLHSAASGQVVTTRAVPAEPSANTVDHRLICQGIMSVIHRQGN